MLVIQQEHFHWQFFAETRCQLLDVHLETAIAIDIDDQRIGTSGLDAHRGWQSKTHRAQSATGVPSTRLAEFVVLGGPHLVLANANGDVGIHFGRDIAERFDRVLLQNAVEFFVVTKRVFCFPLQALFLPIGDVWFLNDLVQFR